MAPSPNAKVENVAKFGGSPLNGNRAELTTRKIWHKRRLRVCSRVPNLAVKAPRKLQIRTNLYAWLCIRLYYTAIVLKFGTEKDIYWLLPELNLTLIGKRVRWNLKFRQNCGTSTMTFLLFFFLSLPSPFILSLLSPFSSPRPFFSGDGAGYRDYSMLPVLQRVDGA